MTTIKPDGYCAWHPEMGFRPNSTVEMRHDLDSYLTSYEERVGWQIVPVHILTNKELEEERRDAAEEVVEAVNRAVNAFCADKTLYAPGILVEMIDQEIDKLNAKRAEGKE